MTPLRKAINMWENSLPARLRRLEMDGLRTMRGQRITYATMFSGSDIVSKAIMALLAHVETKHGIAISQENVFKCDEDEEKQEFLKEQYPEAAALFEDASQLGTAAKLKNKMMDQRCKVQSI